MINSRLDRVVQRDELVSNFELEFFKGQGLKLRDKI